MDGIQVLASTTSTTIYKDNVTTSHFRDSFSACKNQKHKNNCNYNLKRKPKTQFEF